MKNFFNHPLTLLIGVVSSIIGIFVFVTGKTDINKIFESEQTQTTPAKKKLTIEGLDGTWVTESKANENVIPYGSKVHFLRIAKVGEFKYRVKYSIDKIVYFEEIFTQNEKELSATFESNFGLSTYERNIYITDNQRLYFEKVFFKKWSEGDGHEFDPETFFN